MALSDQDVREILRIIDESDLDELEIETSEFKLHVRRGGAPAPAPAEEAPAPAPASTDGAHTIEAPMLGTFYRAEGPSAEPFVEVGAQVEPSTVVCIIEVMKMMNSVEAGVSGTIAEICVDDAEMVEEGAPLFRVKTA